MDEPYNRPELNERLDWCRANGVEYLRPNWDGIYAPAHAIPHLFCAGVQTVEALAANLAKLAKAGALSWDGESARYFDDFISPARLASGRPRQRRPIPALHGIERNGALPYGANRRGQTSPWRPAKRIRLEQHLTVGPLLSAFRVFLNRSTT